MDLHGGGDGQSCYLIDGRHETIESRRTQSFTEEAVERMSTSVQEKSEG